MMIEENYRVRFEIKLTCNLKIIKKIRKVTKLQLILTRLPRQNAPFYLELTLLD